MTITSIKQQLGIDGSWSAGDIVVGPGVLGDEFDTDVLALHGGHLTVAGASYEVDDDDRFVLSGSAPLLEADLAGGAVARQPARAVRLEVAERDGRTVAALWFPVDVDTLGSIFPKMPTMAAEDDTAARRTMIQMFSSMASWRNVSVVMQGGADQAPADRAGFSAVRLQGGLNLVGRCEPAALLSDLGVDDVPAVTLVGSVAVDASDEIPVLVDTWPWEVQPAARGIAFHADLTDHLTRGLGLDELGAVRSVALRSFTALDDTLAAAPEYWPQLAVEITLEIGGASGALVVPLTSWAGGVRYTGSFDGLTLATALSSLAGTATSSVVPGEIADQLDQIALERLAIGMEGDGSSMGDVSFAVDLGGVAWDIGNGDVDVALERLHVRVLRPGRADVRWLATIDASVQLVGADFGVTVFAPDFAMSGRMKEGSTLDLSTAFERVAGIEPPVRVEIDVVEVKASSSGEYELVLGVAETQTMPRLEVSVRDDGWSISGSSADGLGLDQLLDELARIVDGLDSGRTSAGGADVDVVAFSLASRRLPNGAGDTFDLSCESRLDVGDLADEPLTLTISGTREDGSWVLRGELDAQALDLGALLESAIRDAGADVDVPAGASLDRAGVELADQIHLSLSGHAGSVQVQLDLWKTDDGWDPLVQIGAAELPDDLPVPVEVSSLLHDTSVRWAKQRIASAPLLGAGPGPVAPGLSLATILRFELTPIGVLLRLPATPVPIEVAEGQLQISFRQELLGAPVQVELLDITVTSLYAQFDSPAALELRLGIDVDAEIESTTTRLRFAGLVRADITDQDVMLAVGFLGAVEDGAVVPWREPFGFPGLAVGHLEVWVGAKLRAFRGALSIGETSLAIEAVLDGIETAVHFDAEQLTIGELVDGFVGAGQVSLPGPIAESGFERLTIDYATTDFTFDWLGEQRRYETGLRGDAHLNLLGLDFTVRIELDRTARRYAIAGSMERLAIGSLVVLEDTDADPELGGWLGDFELLGGPWAQLQLGDPTAADLHAKLTLFGIISKQVDGRFDEEGLSLRLQDRVGVESGRGKSGAELRWTSDLLVSFRRSGGLPDMSISGSMSAKLRINPSDLIEDLTGFSLDVDLLDVDIVDVAIDLAASAYVRNGVVGGSLSGAFVLWGERLSFSISVALDLDLAGIARHAITAIENAGRAILRFFEDALQAIEEAVTAVVEAIGEVAEDIGEAFQSVLRAIDDLGRALDELGRIIEELAEAAAAEVASWFGDDGPKRRIEARKLSQQREVERRKARKRAEQARLAKLRDDRRIMVLDVAENLSDAAIIDSATAVAVQRRIDDFDRTRINPFTQVADHEPTQSRAAFQAMWSAALGRARRRSELREEYQAVLDQARDVLADADADVERLRTRRSVIAADRDRLDARLKELEGREQELRDEYDKTASALHDQQAELMKAQIALHRAENIERDIGEQRTDATELRSKGTALSNSVDQLTIAIELAQLEQQLGVTQAAIDELGDQHSVAEAMLDAAIERAGLLRAARRQLTLARFDTVRRTLSTSLDASEVFQAWAAACEEAGDPSHVCVTALRSHAIQLLQGIQAETERAAADAVNEARSLVDDLRAAPWATVQLGSAQTNGDDVPLGLTPSTTALREVAQLIEPAPDVSLAGSPLEPWTPFPTSTNHAWTPATMASALVAIATAPDTTAVDAARARLVASARAVLDARRALRDAESRDAADRAVAALHRELQQHRISLPGFEDGKARAERGERIDDVLEELGDALLTLAKPFEAFGRWLSRTAVSDQLAEVTAQLANIDTSIDEFLSEQDLTGLTRASGLDQAMAIAERISVTTSVIDERDDEGGDTHQLRERLTEAVAAFASAWQQQQRTADIDLRTEEETDGETAPAQGAAGRSLVAAWDTAVGQWAAARLDGQRQALAALTALTATTNGTSLLASKFQDPAPLVSDQTVSATASAAVTTAQGELELVQRAGATLVAPDHAPGAVVTELQRWSTVIAAHAAAVRAVRGELATPDDRLDAIAVAVADEWERAVLALIASDRRRTTGAANIALPAAPALPDPSRFEALNAVTRGLRTDFEARRAELDQALDQFTDLAVEDTKRLLTDVDTVRAALSELATTMSDVEQSLTDLDGAIQVRLARPPYDGTGVAGYPLGTVRRTQDVEWLGSAVSAAHAATREVSEVTARLDALSSLLDAAEQQVGLAAGLSDAQRARSLDRQLTDLDARFTSLIAEYRSAAGTATRATADITDLIAKIHAHIADLRSAHDDLHEQHLAIMAWAFEVAWNLDLRRVEHEQLRQLTVRADQVDVADPAEHEIESAMEDVSAAIDAMTVADLQRQQLADDLRAQIHARTALLAVTDPDTAPLLDAALSTLETSLREQHPGVPDVRADAADGPAIEVRSRLHGQRQPSGHVGSGWSVACRVRVGDGTTARLLAAGPLAFDVDGGTLVVSWSPPAEHQQWDVRSPLPPETTHDLCLVVDPAGWAMLWTDGIPVAHRVVDPGTALDWLPDVAADQPAASDVAIADVRVWTRRLHPAQIRDAATVAPDERDIDLVSHSLLGALGALAPLASRRAGVPDGQILIVTPNGDLTASGGPIELPPDTTHVALGHGAAVALFDQPDGAGPLGDRYVDLGTDELAPAAPEAPGPDPDGGSVTESRRARAVAARSRAETLGGQRWVLDVPVRGARRYLATELGPTGRLTLRGHGGAPAHFRLTTTPDRSATGDRELIVRSALLDQSLRLAPDPRCEVVAGTGVRVGPLPPAGDGSDLALDSSTPPVEVALEARFDDVTAAVTLLRWRHRGRPLHLQLVGGRLHLVADDREVVASSDPVESGAWYRIRLDGSATVATMQTEIVSQEGPSRDDVDADPGLARRRGCLGSIARRPKRRGATRSGRFGERLRRGREQPEPLAIGAELVDDESSRVGRLVELIATWPTHEHTDVDRRFDASDSIVVRPVIDSVHATEATPSSGVVRGSTPVELSDSWTASLWFDVPESGPWSALRIDDPGDLGLVQLWRPTADGPVRIDVPGSGPDLELAADELAPGRHHLAVVRRHDGRTTEAEVWVDGVRRATELGTRARTGWARLEVGDDRCSVTHVALFGEALAPNEIAREIVRPSFPTTPAPLLRWRLADDDVAWDDRGPAPVPLRAPGDLAPQAELDELLPTRAPLDDDAVLIAEPLGRRHGRPTFRLGERSGGVTWWLAVVGDEVTSTTDVDEAAEVGLRALVLDVEQPGGDRPWYSAVGAPGETPSDVSVVLDEHPVTNHILQLRHTWQEELRAAVGECASVDLERWDEVTRATSMARTVLDAADIEIRRRDDDLDGWRADVEAALAVTRKDLSGLLFTGEEQGVDVPLSPTPSDELTASYWVRLDQPAPSGRAIAGAAAGAAPGQAAWAIVHEGSTLRFSIGDERVRIDLGETVRTGWARVVISWRSDSGETVAAIDGRRQRAGVIARGQRLADAPRLVIGGNDGAQSFVGHLEQVAVAARVIEVDQPITHVPTGAGDEHDWTIALPGQRRSEGTPWRRTERGSAVVDIDSPPSAALVDRRRRATAVWRERLDTWRSADDPVAAAIAAAPGEVEGSDDLERFVVALGAFGARPTRAALGWNLALWRKALASWDRHELTVDQRRSEIDRIGIDIHRSIGAPASDVARALRRGSGPRIEALQRQRWHPSDGDRRSLDELDAAALTALEGEPPALAELALRRLGLEPRTVRASDPAARLDLLTEAAGILDHPDLAPLDRDRIHREIRAGRLALLPLLMLAEGDWISELARAGLELPLGAEPRPIDELPTASRVRY